MRVLTDSELLYVAGGSYVGGDNSPPSGDVGSPPQTDASHWFDNAASSTISYDGAAGQGLGGMVTSYFDANGQFIGDHTDYNNQPVTPNPTYDGGYFGSITGGDGVIGGLAVAYGANSGVNVYVNVGVGTPGLSLSGGYTNDVNGFLEGLSGSISGDFKVGSALTPDAQNGALTIGTPGWTATYGVNAQSAIFTIARGIDRMVLK